MLDDQTLACIQTWRLPEEGPLLGRVSQMVEPSILAGCFGSSRTQLVSGLQYHLGGATDTRELAELAHIGPDDQVLDVACYLGGPALQLVDAYGCRVTGIDHSEKAIAAAHRIAELTGLADRLRFEVADAANMPFEDNSFTVVWNQGSLNHDEAWLREFDRVLVPGGRLALVAEIRPNQAPPDDRWTLEELANRVCRMGYRIDHVFDLMTREIERGWGALIERLEERRGVYVAARGEAWVDATRQAFREEIEAMRQNKWSNGRLIATKMEHAP